VSSVRGQAPGNVTGPGDIQVGRFETFLRRYLSVKRGGLVRDVAPGFSLSLDPAQGLDFENRFHLGVRSYSISTVLAAGAAGEEGRLYVFNPLGSRGIIVVERAYIIVAAASAGMTIAITQADSALGAIGFGPHDSRITLNYAAPVPGFTSLHANNAAAVAGPIQTLEANGAVVQTRLDLSRPVVLTPGNGVVLEGPTVTQTLFHASWYERAAEASELVGG
jgi:hypothetical protein